MALQSITRAIAFAILLAAGGAGAAAQSASPWTGLYIGINGGYGTAKDTDPKVKGFIGGLHAGYGHQFGHVVAGIEGDISMSRMSASQSFDFAPIGTLTIKEEVDNLWSIRGRLGFLATKDLLVYATAGYGGFKATASASIAEISEKVSVRANGLVGGGGLEMAFTRDILGRIEGLYYMGKGTGIVDGAEQDIMVVRAGLSYRF